MHYIEEFDLSCGGKPLFLKELSDGDIIITTQSNIKNKNIKTIDLKNDIINANNIIKLIRDYSIEIFIIHGLKFLNDKVLEKIKENNVKIIFIVHDYYALCERYSLINNKNILCSGPYHNNCVYCYIDKFDFLANFGRQTQDVLIPLISVFNKRIKYYKNRLNAMKLLFEKVDLIIFPTEKSKNIFTRFFKNNKYIILHHFQKVLICKREKPKEPIFAFIGHSAYHKGYGILEELSQKIRNKNFKILMYGKFDNKIKDKRFIYKEQFDHNNIENIFEEFDVLIFPSIWPEVFGRVLSEAAITGKLIVASNITPANEILKNYECLYRYSHYNSKELAKTINKIYKNWDKISYPCKKISFTSISEYREKIINSLLK